MLKKSRPDVPIILAGLQEDAFNSPEAKALPSWSGVTKDRIKEVAKEIGAVATLTCSAKENTGVQEVLQEAVRVSYAFKFTKEGVQKKSKDSRCSVS